MENETNLIPIETELIRINVYRMYQRVLHSPCVMGKPCRECQAHARCQEGRPCHRCRRGETPCRRAYTAPPAFTVTRLQALALIKRGLAEFILRRTALRLTFSQMTYLRDQSLRIDEQFLIAYAQGDPQARAIIEDDAAGWAVQPPVTEVPLYLMRKYEEQVIYFG